jgi:N6-L-threonylcarbamoyladenine synthase
MLCLGIESTAHTFGAAVVSEEKCSRKRPGGKVLSNIRDSYATKKGGIIPAEAADHHLEVCGRVIKEALSKAGVSLNDIGLISFSQGPGIGHTLRIGAMSAKSLSVLAKKPLIGVNHCIAHLEIGRMLFSECKDPILLYASGANTQVIAYEAGKYRIFGETLDIGIGNFLDQFARELGLGFPGGPKIYELSQNSKNYVELPYVVKGMDVSFGGLLTNLKHKIQSGRFRKEDLAYSCQETAFAMLLEVSERALAHCEKSELLLGGGVACNKRLQEMAKEMCKARGARCFIPDNEFLVDNAAMIAWQGLLEYRAGRSTGLHETSIRPYERTDDIIVNWR